MRRRSVLDPYRQQLCPLPDADQPAASDASGCMGGDRDPDAGARAMTDAGGERWRRLTVKEGWRRFVSDEPTRRPERVGLGDYRRLDEGARSVYYRERLRHAHGFGPIRSL